MQPNKTNPNPSSSFLTSLKKLSNILAHLLNLKFPPIPQQLNPWNAKFQ